MCANQGRSGNGWTVEAYSERRESASQKVISLKGRIWLHDNLHCSPIATLQDLMTPLPDGVATKLKIAGKGVLLEESTAQPMGRVGPHFKPGR